MIFDWCSGEGCRLLVHGAPALSRRCRAAQEHGGAAPKETHDLLVARQYRACITAATGDNACDQCLELRAFLQLEQVVLLQAAVVHLCLRAKITPACSVAGGFKTDQWLLRNVLLCDTRPAAPQITRSNDLWTVE